MNFMSTPLEAFYAKIDPHNLAPLWRVMATLVPPAPQAKCQPAHWPYAMARDLLIESGELISAELAERRVLVLENPALRGMSQATNSLYAGLQLILPGETAPAHRHSATAIRLILEGEGGFTSVDGESTPMSRGDFIITPSWTYHSHENPGSAPMIWLDGLDVPIVQFLDAGFSQRLDDSTGEPKRVEDESLARFASGLLPIGFTSSESKNPVFRYPYDRTKSALEKLSTTGEVHHAHGLKMQFSNPTTGRHATATMAAFVQWLPKGFSGTRYRSTDAAVYCVIEGHGRSRIGESDVAWSPNDVFVVPSWTPVSHLTDEDCVLFSMSDRATQSALGLWRESIEI